MTSQVPLAQAQPLDDAGAKVFDEYIRARRELLDYSPSLIRFGVDCHAALVPVDHVKGNGLPLLAECPTTHRVPSRSLDLDHLSAHLRQDPRAVRAGEIFGEVDDPNTAEEFRRLTGFTSPRVRTEIHRFARTARHRRPSTADSPLASDLQTAPRRTFRSLRQAGLRLEAGQARARESRTARRPPVCREHRPRTLGGCSDRRS